MFETLVDISLTKENFNIHTIPEVGELVPGEGVYLGYHPICSDPVRGEEITSKPVLDNQGHPICHHFFAFAQDLKGRDEERLRLSFKEASKEVASIKDYYEQKGAYFKNNKNFLTALKKGQYDGEWRVPSSDILNLMYSLREQGAFKGTFEEKDPIASCYGTSSKNPDFSWSWQQYFYDGARGEDRNRNERLCRPIRSQLNF